jgi:hypothetical protein
LAGKSSHDEVRTLRQLVQRRDVGVERRSWKARAENRERGRIDLTQQTRAMARTHQAQLETPDAREQSRDPKASAASSLPHLSLNEEARDRRVT